jgi:hypothetical protein
MKTLLLVMLASGMAFAGLTITLNPNAQPGSTGAEALFSGTLTNTSATERLFLNDIAASFTADPQSDTALAGNAFFANVPGILDPGEVYAGPLFRIALSAVSPAVNYAGTITLRGGADILADNALAGASFTLLATPVEQWRHQTFGDAAASPAAADTADADGDGTQNLLEYALALDALTPDVALLPAPFVLNDHLALSYVPLASDVSYSVESSLNLLQWGTADVEQVIVPSPQPPNRVTFRFKDAISVSGKAFLRLKVSR